MSLPLLSALTNILNNKKFEIKDVIYKIMTLSPVVNRGILQFMNFDEVIIRIDHSEVEKDENYWELFNSSKDYLTETSTVWGKEFLKFNDQYVNIEEWRIMISLFIEKANEISFFPLQKNELRVIVNHVYIYTWYKINKTQTFH